MKSYSMSSFSEAIGDFIVFRNLVPQDGRIPSLDSLRAELNLPAGLIPRKNEQDYARAVSAMLREARKLDAPKAKISNVIFLGDTKLLDATAFSNICTAVGVSGIAFIGSESAKPAQIEVEQVSGGQTLYLSNRWAALDNELASGYGIQPFESFIKENGFEIGEHTALLIDMDKTALGARGRNAAMIDAARVQAVFETVADLLGEQFDAAAFQRDYDLIIQPEFHPFTEDNQDYVAYICLVLGSGLYALEPLVEAYRKKEMVTFKQFIGEVETQREKLTPALQKIHAEIFSNVQAGDPTPFKPFRYNEYRLTVAKLGCLPKDAPVENLLAEEIVLTAEVLRLAQRWKAQGALVFALSDKPDEASIPTTAQREQGLVPLHRKLTHVVGE